MNRSETETVARRAERKWTDGPTDQPAGRPADHSHEWYFFFSMIFDTCHVNGNLRFMFYRGLGQHDTRIGTDDDLIKMLTRCASKLQTVEIATRVAILSDLLSK